MAALRANYHRILDKIELMLPAKLRPLYNHPAGNVEFPPLGVRGVSRGAVHRWGVHPAVLDVLDDPSSCYGWISRRGSNGSSCLSVVGGSTVWSCCFSTRSSVYHRQFESQAAENEAALWGIKFWIWGEFKSIAIRKKNASKCSLISSAVAMLLSSYQLE